jgi:drug/metabolite transporter (DMT)-like permease
MNPIWFLISFISALLSAAAALAQKKVLFKIDAFRFSLLVSAAGLMTSAPFFFVTDYHALNTASLSVLFIKSLLSSLGFYFVMQSIKKLELSEALPLLALTPGLVAISAFLFLGEKISAYETGGMLFLIAGTYILEAEKNGDILAPLRILFVSKKYRYVIAALAVFTISSVLDKAILSKFRLPVNAFMAFQQVFIAIVFFACYLFSKRRSERNFFLPGTDVWIWIAVIALLTAGYRFAQITAVKMAPVAVVLSVKRLSVFFTVVLGGHIFKERSLLKKTIATAIIIVGTIIIMKE